MNYTDNALNILTAQTYKGIGKAWIHRNLVGNEPLEVIVETIKTKDNTVSDDGFYHKRKDIEKKILELGEDNCDGFIALGDKNFPFYHGKVKEADRPIALFYKGDLSLLNDSSQNIAVIGVLQPDDETQTDERKVVNSLVQNGATIVSGLAEGCDSIAHHQALVSRGATIAILPSPLNHIIPSSRIPLANAIVERGSLIISEYYTKPIGREQTSRYVERDRLQALYSDMVILTSSYAKNDLGNDSGSRHAMGKAKDYGLARAVIYNSVRNANNPKYELNRQIINETPPPFIIDPDDCELFVHDMLNTINKNKTTIEFKQSTLF